MKSSCGGIILSGGQNARMYGRNKAFMEIGGQRFVERIAGALSEILEERLLVTREPELYTGLNLRVVEDILQARSPLTGIHSGLVHLRADFGVCVSCDMPLLRSRVIHILKEEIEERYDIIVPATGTFYQPLCAVYSKRCLPFIENQLNENDLKVDRLFRKVRVKKIPYERIEIVDPDLDSFFNVNTPEDIHTALQLLQRNLKVYPNRG